MTDYQHWYWNRGGRDRVLAKRNAVRAAMGREPNEHAQHVCSLCGKPNHNIRTCQACQRCGGKYEFATNLGRFCGRCLEAVA